jgi:hypothetical protein
MAHLPNSAFPAVRPSPDGKWLRCPQCSEAYWGAFRPTDFILAKLTAHVERKHKAPAAPDDAAAANLLPAPKQKRKAGVGKRAAAKAEAKGDGRVQIARVATTDLKVLEQGVADALADIQAELNPRLQLAQGPRDFPEDGGARHVRDANRGQDVVARVQAQLSPIKGWA